MLILGTTGLDFWLINADLCWEVNLSFCIKSFTVSKHLFFLHDWLELSSSVLSTLASFPATANNKHNDTMMLAPRFCGGMVFS